MKTRKLKGYVIPLVYSLAVCAVFGSVLLLLGGIKTFIVGDNTQYVLNPILDYTVSVVEIKNTEIIKPYNDQSITINKEFYSKDKDEESQKKSLIYYQNTYMQNSGILYSGNAIFDVVAVLDGKVANIKQDELLGTIVEIEHTPSLVTSYQCLSEAKVTLGSEIKQGDIIGTSGTTKLVSNANNLLFEVHLNGKNINPEEFYAMKIEDLNI